MSDFWGHSKNVKTRKLHSCTFCGWRIPLGETAYYGTGVFDGSFFSSYAHLECLAEFRATDEVEYVTGEIAPPQRIRDLYQAVPS